MFGTKLKQYGERIAEQARKEGRDVGREEGREVEREEIALRMLDQGRSSDEIADITGLSKERIERLRK